MVAINKIMEISVTNDGETLIAANSQENKAISPSSELFMAEFETLMGNDINIYENLTNTMGQLLDNVLGNRTYGSTQGATFANIFQWATLPDGLYHPEITYKGVAGAVAMVSHFVLMVFVKLM